VNFIFANGGKTPSTASDQDVIQFVHFSPEGVFLIIEVPVVAGRKTSDQGFVGAHPAG